MKIRIAGPLVALALLMASPAAAQDCSTDRDFRRTGDPEYLVACELKKAGGSSAMEANPAAIARFLRALAATLNDAVVPGGPFGVLVKTGGNQCGGYSCDIICSGNGSAQKQWDVLIGAGDPGGSRPSWDGPLGTIAVRPCEVVFDTPPAPAPVPAPPAPNPAPEEPGGITHEDLADDLLELGKTIEALERLIVAIGARVDAAAASAASAAQTAADIKGIVSVGAGVPPAALPLYKGDLWGIPVISKPCPECRN